MILKAWQLMLLAVLLAVCGCRRDGSAANSPPVSPRPSVPAGTGSAPDKPPEEPAGDARAQPKLRTVTLWLGAEELTAEVALTREQQRKGMMFRPTIGENEAMLFVFPTASEQGFWMKNTSVPLSVAYIDPRGTILEIYDLEPHHTEAVESKSDNIQFVLEVKRGWFERHKIREGTVIRTDRGTLRERFVTRR